MEVEQLKEFIKQNNSENSALERQVEYLSKLLGGSTAHVEKLIDESNKNSKNAIVETEQLKNKDLPQIIHLIRENNATRFKSPFYETNDCGETPLLVAILHQQHEAIEVLMNHYLNPIGVEAEGNSLLHYATKFNRMHVIRRLGCHYTR